MNNALLGRHGEELAQQYLKDHGYVILNINFRTRFGEIDIIAEKEDDIAFVEVKTRVGDIKGKPYEAVGYYKIKHLQKAIQFYLLSRKLPYTKLRMDVISIILEPNHTVSSLKHFENIST